MPSWSFAPLVFQAWQPVRNDAPDRAWSPGPSPQSLAVSWASPVTTWNLPLQVLHRRERLVERVVLPLALREPPLVVAPVREADERGPQRHARRRSWRARRAGAAGGRGGQRFEARQGDARAQPAEEGAAVRVERESGSWQVASSTCLVFFSGRRVEVALLVGGGRAFGAWASPAGSSEPRRSPRVAAAGLERRAFDDLGQQHARTCPPPRPRGGRCGQR